MTHYKVGNPWLEAYLEMTHNHNILHCYRKMDPFYQLNGNGYKRRRGFFFPFERSEVYQRRAYLS